MTQSKSRPWYRLHRSTWVVLAAVLAVLTVIIVPGFICGGFFPGPSLYVHGWPFVCLDRVAWPDGSPLMWNESPDTSLDSGIRPTWTEGGDSELGFLSGEEPLWLKGSNWPFSGRSAVWWPGLAGDLAVVLCIFAMAAAACELWHRRLRQRRLLNLIILALLISSALVWWGTTAAQCAREQRLIAVLQGHAFEVEFESAAPVWLSRLLGEKRLPFHVVEIRGPMLCREPIPEDHPAGDGGVAEGNQHARAAIELAKALPHLSSVFLVIQADDLTVAHLAGLERITSLRLDEARITNEGMKAIGGLGRLEELQVSSMEGSMNGVPCVAAQVTDGGLEHLRSLTRLEQLTLDGIPITDAGLDHLKGLTGLRELTLLDTKVTDEGVEKLRKALPNCQIGKYEE